MKQLTSSSQKFLLTATLGAFLSTPTYASDKLVNDLDYVSNVELSAKRIGDWDTRIANDTNYDLVNGKQVKDEHGWLLNFHATSIPKHSDLQAMQLQANYVIGQLSQEFEYQVMQEGTAVGVCTIHSGLGSYWANPDFTGSKCTLTNGDHINVNPGYRINGEIYEVKYTISQDTSFSRLFVFGDSLSDNGNLYSKDGGLIPTSPPYYRGRFSDGPIWAEYLKDYFGMSDAQLQDYAYGNAYSDPASNIFFPLSSQIWTYKMGNYTADSQAMYAIWIGANDLLSANNMDDTSTSVLSHIADAIRELSDYGAKTFLVPNIPDLGKTVRAINNDRKAGNHEYSERMHNAVVLHNKRLASATMLLEQELGIKIYNYDIYETMNDIFVHPAKYGFNNIVTGCNPNGVFGNSQPICETPDTYLFWDELHPTTAAHQRLAKIVYQQITGTD